MPNRGFCLATPPNREPKLSGSKRLWAWLSNNAIQLDSEEAAASLLSECPTLLQEDEHIELAFKVERDRFYFTTSRLLFRNVKAFTGRKVMYKSVPYTSMTAFAVQLAGAVLDSDSEVRIWTEMPLLGEVTLSFVKGMVDVFAIKRLLNAKLLDIDASRRPLPEEESALPVPAAAFQEAGLGERVLNFIGDDAVQMDPQEMEHQMQAVLHGNERVLVAVEGHRKTLLTTKRILVITDMGCTGTKLEYKSVPWRSVRAFSLQTPGAVLDRDAELQIWSGMRQGLKAIRQDLREDKVDVLGIQKLITDHVLGMSSVELSGEANPNHITGSAGGLIKFFQWAGDDAAQIDPRQVEVAFHANVPILQDHEHIEMAFRGRRDMVLFTTKRLLFVDVKGWTGEKVEYISVPWTTIQAFSVCHAGPIGDKDSEMMIWTDIMFEPAKSEDEEPTPGMSYLQQDFCKDQVDLLAVQRYLSAKVLHTNDGDAVHAAEALVLQDVTTQTPPGALESFHNWIGGDAHQIDVAAVDQQLHTELPALLSDERVELAFKMGWDLVLFTTRRVLLVVLGGYMFKSVPYSCMKAFSVESAGLFDIDATLTLYLKTPWMETLQQDLRKGRADVIGLQMFLASKLLGTGSDPMDQILASVPDAMPEGLSWLSSRQVEPREVDRQLHSSPPILLNDETVIVGFKVGRDMRLFTSKRMLVVDVKGTSGEKVNYLSIPYACCQAYSVQSAGKFDFEKEALLWTCVPGCPMVGISLSADSDLFELQAVLASLVMKPTSADEEHDHSG